MSHEPRPYLAAEGRTALPDLPGSTTDPGEGPVVEELLDQMLDVVVTARPGTAAPQPVEPVFRGPDRDLVATLLVDAEALLETDGAPLAAVLRDGDHQQPVLLRAADIDGLHRARALLDDERVQLVGVRLAPVLQSSAATRAMLAELAVSVPAWVEVSPGQGWAEVIDAVQEDGAENLAVVAGPPGDDARALATLLRRVVDRDLSVRAGTRAGTGLPLITDATGCGVLNLLAAVRAALNGAEVDALAGVLNGTDPAPLTSALRRMSEADAAVTRAFLIATEVDAAPAVAGLRTMGLLAG